MYLYFSPVILQLCLTIGSALNPHMVRAALLEFSANPDTAARTMSDHPLYLTVVMRESRSYDCESVFQTCIRPVIEKMQKIIFLTI